MITDVLSSTPIDLGFNNTTDDSCDYWDYLSEPTTDLNYGTTPGGLGLLQLNVRGVLGKQNLLKNLLNDVRQKTKVHMVMLVETWLKKNNAHRVQIPGYQFVGSHRKFKRGGGVGILIARNLEYRERKDLSLNVPNLESITVEVKTNRDSLLLCALYRPPNSNDRDFSKNYSRLLRKFTPDQLNRLIIGLDHNLDLIKHDKHRITNEFIEINLDNQLLPTITKPTRITRTTATLIDNIIIGRKFQSDFEACILISDISDLLPCLITVKKLSLFEKSPIKITTRGLNEHKINTLNDKLSEVNWKEQFHSKDVDQ